MKKITIYKYVDHKDRNAEFKYNGVIDYKITDDIFYSITYVENDIKITVLHKLDDINVIVIK